MTNLEKKIYERALEIIPDLQKKAEEIVSEARYITFPFLCDGVIDKLIFDTVLKKFTKIEYSKGKGNGVQLDSLMNESSAYFDEDEIEYFSFEIPDTEKP